MEASASKAVAPPGFLCAWGHSPDLPGGKPQLLMDHLLGTALRAWSVGLKLGYPALCYTLGLLHDSGKQSVLFQDYIHGNAESGGDHKGLGAAQLLEFVQSAVNVPDGDDARSALWGVVAPIVGHHGGMPDRTKLADIEGIDVSSAVNPLYLGLNPVAAEDGVGHIETVVEWPDEHPYPTVAALLEELEPEVVRFVGLDTLDRDLLARFLLSALVDADWSDTAEFYHGPDRSKVAEADFGSRIRELFNFRVVNGFTAPTTSIDRLRGKFFNEAVATAAAPTGLFNLTMPTGAAKTLAGLGFALNHANLNDLDRIVIAAPYNNILSQNAAVYRGLFADEGRGKSKWGRGDDSFIFEDFGGSDDQNRYQAKSQWNNPLILTSFVKVLEMLHGNQASALRPLHNLAHSVVILDEIQALPIGLSGTTVQVLDSLARQFGTSVVFSTGTDPHFVPNFNKHLTGMVTQQVIGGDRRNRAAAPATTLAVINEATPVVTVDDVDWRAFENRAVIDYTYARVDTLPLGALSVRQGSGGMWFSELVVDQIVEAENDSERNALIIVNTVKKAKAIAEETKKRLQQEELDIPVISLTTKHTRRDRDAHLRYLRNRLKDGLPVIAVATQLIEAGVDVDFAVGWREIAPIPSIEQAAGRINRSGRRPNPGTLRVVQFSDEPGFSEAAPSYMNGVNKTKLLLADNTLGENRKEDNQQYFDKVLKTTGSQNPMDSVHGIKPDGTKQPGMSLLNERRKANFKTVNTNYRIVPSLPVFKFICLPTDDPQEALEVHSAFNRIRDWFTNPNVDKRDRQTASTFKRDITLLSDYTVEVLKTGKDETDFIQSVRNHVGPGEPFDYFKSDSKKTADIIFLCPTALYDPSDGLQEIGSNVAYTTTEVF